METREAIYCLECGALCPAPPSGTGAAGYAVMADGKRICYACADAHERKDLQTADKFVVYVGDRIVTTWTGGKLGTITDSWRTTVAGHDGVAYRITDIHGNRWAGRHGGMFSGKGMALKIRRVK